MNDLTPSIASQTSLVSSDYNIDEAQRLAKLYVASGFFSDVKDIAQAFVKIQAGAELGLSAVTSMTEVYIVKGRIALSARAMATVAAKAGYRFGIKEHTAEKCMIEVYRDDALIGRSAFTMADARTAGLRGDNWTKYPKNMLWARAMSNACKWCCADAFGGGSVYTPEELTPAPPQPTKTTEDLNKQLASADTTEGADNWPAVKETKKKVAEHVTLKDSEWNKLCKEHGETKAYELVQLLNNYKGQNGKRYKSDYRAILNWVVKRWEDDHAKETKAEKQARMFDELDEITSDEGTVIEIDAGDVQTVAIEGS